MSEAMLAIYLCEHPMVWGDFKRGAARIHPLDMPRGFGLRAKVKGKWNRRAPRLLDITPKIQTVLGIESSLVPAACILVKDVREAQAMQ